ncbi:MAG: GTPase Era [Candidatus Nanopelagicales bacterium]|nr:GTPase Era [Candidatus Nanopelagicales bacterium]
MEHHSGFVSIVGRPNVGKSTLTNRIIGQKIAIMSSRPQTTRRIIRGILTTEDAQLILVDTPGLHRPRTLLGERLNDQVRETWATVDAIGLCLPADEQIGPGDRFIAGQIVELGNKPIVVIVTKADKVNREALAERLLDAQLLGEQLGVSWASIIPVSSNNGENIDELVAVFTKLLPVGPDLYIDGEVTDEPLEIMIAELIREAALEGVEDELPHSIAVTIEEMSEREDRPADKPMMDIHANLFVERDSQKGIIIGKGGSRLKHVGAKSRQGIEHLVGMPVYLNIRVKVAKDWQKNPKQLRKLGF